MDAINFISQNPLKSNHRVSNKNNSFNNKDFSSTLESVDRKTNNKQLFQNTSKANEGKKTVISEKDELLKENEEIDVESQEENESQKDCSHIHGNLILFSNNIVDVENEIVEDEEIELKIDNEIKSGSQVLESNIENALVVDEVDDGIPTEKESLDIGKKEIQNSKELNSIKIESDHILKSAEDNSNEESKLIDTELKTNSKALEFKKHEEKNLENPVTNKINLSNTEEFGEEMEFNSEQNHSSETLLSDKKLDDTKGERIEQEPETNDKPFILIDKNSIKFIKNDSVELEKPDIINRKEVINQIIEKAKINLFDGKNEIRVKLKPEVLGEMTMNIEVVKGTVIAKIMVDNQRTKEIIEGNLMQLKEGIKETGLEIKTVEVFVGNNSNFDKHNSGQFNLKQNHKKVKIKPQSPKVIMGYGEQVGESEVETNETYLKGSLNLFA